MATTVSIGRSVQGEPMDVARWTEFQTELDHIVSRYCRELFFQGQGLGWSDQWGAELAYTIVAADMPSWVVYADFKRDLEDLRGRYGQDAIAVTQGYTEFI